MLPLSQTPRFSPPREVEILLCAQKSQTATYRRESVRFPSDFRRRVKKLDCVIGVE